MANFQDVIRDVYNEPAHALQTTDGGATIFAVVNTSAQNGQATVNINGSATIYAVVNTAAAGVGNSIVTINPRVDYIGLMSVSGNVNVGTPTVFVGTPTLNAVVNIPSSIALNGNITIDSGNISLKGNVTITDSKGFIGLTTTVIGSTPTIYAVVNTVAASGFATVNLNTGAAYIGLVTVANTVPVTGTFFQSTQPVSFGNVTITDSKGYIGLTTSTIGNNPVLGSGVNSVGFATVAISNPTLFAVVNTSAAGTGNSMVTINPRVDYFGLVSVSGNVAVSALPATPTGANYIGLASVQGNVAVSALPATPAGANFIGLVTVANTIPVTFSGNVTLTDPKTYIGSVSVSGTVGANLNAGINGIGFATVNVVNQPALVASSAFIGLVTVANTVPVTFSGNVTISDSKGFIGLTSIQGNVNANLQTGTLNIGSVSVLGGSINANLQTGTLNIGSVSILGGTIGSTLAASSAFVGLVTVANTVTVGAHALTASTVNIGSVSILGGTLGTITAVTDITNPVALKGNVTISDSKGFIGLTTSVIGSAPTIYAVVNTSAAGVGNSIVTINPRTDYFGLVSVSGNVAVSSLPALVNGVGNIGFATVAISTPTLFAVVNSGAASDPHIYIGLTTVDIGTNNTVKLGTNTLNVGSVSVLGGTIAVSSLPALVASTVNIGSVSVLGGGIGLNAGINNIGFATVAVSTPTIFAVVNTSAAGVGNSIVTINPRTDYFGLVSVSGNVAVSALPALVASSAYIGLATTVNASSTANIGSVSVLGGTINSTLQASTLNVGSVSVLGGTISNNINAGVNWIGFATIANALSWPDPKTFIGLATTVNGAGTQFIGLVTAWSRNAGTSKTLINLPVAMSASSITTIAVPTGGNAIFYITQNLINSDATVRVNIKSGATYLTGNASIGITLNPGGGWVENGGVDAPNYIGLASGAAIVIEKLDLTGTSSKISGKIMYFQE